MSSVASHRLEFQQRFSPRGWRVNIWWQAIRGDIRLLEPQIPWRGKANPQVAGPFFRTPVPLDVISPRLQTNVWRFDKSARQPVAQRLIDKWKKKKRKLRSFCWIFVQSTSWIPFFETTKRQLKVLEATNTRHLFLSTACDSTRSILIKIREIPWKHVQRLRSCCSSKDLRFSLRLASVFEFAEFAKFSYNSDCIYLKHCNLKTVSFAAIWKLCLFASE